MGRNDFGIEESSLLEAGLAVLKLDSISVPENEITQYKAQEPEFSKNIIRKLSKLSNDKATVDKVAGTLTKNAIISQNMMSELKQNHGEYFEQVTSVAAKRAEQLYMEALDSEPETQKINYQIKELSKQFQITCKLHGDNLDTISQGTIADWLMNCTLDFK